MLVVNVWSKLTKEVVHVGSLCRLREQPNEAWVAVLKERYQLLGFEEDGRGEGWHKFSIPQEIRMTVQVTCVAPSFIPESEDSSHAPFIEEVYAQGTRHLGFSMQSPGYRLKLTAISSKILRLGREAPKKAVTSTL